VQRIISFLFLIVFLCTVVCKADVDSQSGQSTLADSEEKQEGNSLIEMAQQGNAEAQSLLGLMYGKGIGAAQDYKKAFEWFKKAAQQNYAEAQYNLGVMYYKGEGVTQDYKKAAEWFTKAAQQGFASAQYNLGKMYHQGIGVPRDYNKAVEWYTKAAQESYAKAQRILGLMYRVGAGVAQDDKKAVEWLRKAAKQGDAEAQYQLGLMYRVGAGVAQDYKRAVEWYTKAAQQGDADAQYQLASMYDFGYGVTQDYKKAVGWYTKAAQQGVIEAQAKLGAMYRKGEGVAQDDKKAVEWLRKAAKQGFAPAQFLMGTSLSLGQGVIEDYVEAYKWVLLAGKNGYDYSEVSKVKDALKRLMTPAQIAQAQDLAKNFAAKKEEVADKEEVIHEKWAKPTNERGELTDECTFGIYTIRTYRTRYGDGSLEILKSGQTIYDQHGWVFEIGDRGSMCHSLEFNLIGGDLTGNGKANVVIYEWSGGAHCCYTMFLFQIDGVVKQIAEIDGEDSVPNFADMDGDSVPELLLHDMSYSYWPGSFADSPCPRVILRWSKNSYIVAPELMISPAPSIQELENEAAKIRESERWTSGPNSEYNHYNIPKELFRNALDLMYADHKDLGWKFIEMAWTEKFPVDKELLEELRKRMASSPYWKQLQEINRDKAKRPKIE